MALIKKTKPLRVRLNCPYNDSYIEFFQMQDGNFERVDHKGDSVSWYHFIKPEDMANTIYLCACMGYTVNGGEFYEHERK